MAFTAVAALATGAGAAALEISVVTALSYVGIAMAVVGAVTKDKQLMQTGGLMSLMGGIGSAIGGAEAAAGSGAAGSAATETQAAEVAMGAPATAAQAVSAPVQTSTAGLMESGGDTGLISTAPIPVATPAMPATTVPVSTSSVVPTSTTVQAPTGLPSGASPSLAGVQGATAPSTPYATYPGEFIKQPADTFFGNVSRVWDGLGGQGKAAMVQLAGGALSGANQSAMWNEKMDLENRALAQKSYGSQVATYNKPGIINAKA